MPEALPEDLAEFAWIARSDRPLVVCDVDEVVLEFLTPFQAYLQSVGHELRPDSFRLNGNVFSLDTGTAATKDAVEEMVESFFGVQEHWQTPVEEAADCLAALQDQADVIFLTAMPPHHFERRRRLLDSHGMPYPMIATGDPKGVVLSLVHGDRTTRVAFIDDIFTNLHSVRDRLPNALLVNLMANREFRALAPHPGEGVALAEDWTEARDIISAFLAEGTTGDVPS